MESFATAASPNLASPHRDFPKSLPRPRPPLFFFFLRPYHLRRGDARGGRIAAASSPSPSDAAVSGSSSPTPGSYAAEAYELTAESVNRALDEVRPYLVADGGNVDVVSVEDGVISLELQGACGSCPSSTTTMKMGIERVLKEKFGDAVKDIRQVFDDAPIETTAQAINNHLDILRPAIQNYGGSVEVIAVNSGDCLVKYIGPDSIGSGIKAAIKEKFPDIVNVVFY
ncbi:NifU-like protein 1, chloroplastic [Ananas comosus]|nr:NifU-like protein 1, chloroplastic [Ananas comosus]